MSAEGVAASVAALYAPPRTMEAERVFIAHHAADEAMLRRLVKHLQPLVAAKRIETWDTTRIAPGSDMRIEVTRQLARARFAMALLSADLLGDELLDLLEKHRAQGAVVIPVLVRPCMIAGTWLAGLQALPGHGRSISAGRAAEQERDLADIAEVLGKLVETRRAQAASVEPPPKPSARGTGKKPRRTKEPGAGSAAPPRAKLPAPRLLVAGPWFGVPAAMREEIRRIWKEGPAGRALARIGGLLQQGEILSAHLAAIMRHGAVVDASPWRAFALRRSLGFRDGETASTEKPAAWQADGTPIGFFGFAPGDLPPLGEAAPEGLRSRVETLSARAPWLAGALRARAEDGVAVSGFEGSDAGWWKVLAPLFGDVAVLTDGAGIVLESAAGKVHRAPAPLDAPPAEPTLDDYARALRVVAGQVRLSGDVEERAIEQVFVALEVTARASDTASAASRSADGAARSDHLERPMDAPADEPATHGAGRPDAGEAEAELEGRRRREPPAERRISADALRSLARRVMLWGTAGTGKSTLLQWLACREVGSEHVPVWVPRIALEPGEIEKQLARLALRGVGLADGPSPALDALQAAITEGRALLLLDGLDEASSAVQVALHERVAPLRSPVIVASRPNVPGVRAAVHGFTEVTLAGLVSGGSERFLRAYFGGAEWIGALLRELHRLPEGATWARTPVLLALAASLYQRARRLPDATLELYREVVRGLLRAACERTDMAFTEVRAAHSEGALRQLARRMLLPAAGDMHVAVPRGEVDPLLLTSGLFTGQTWLRFAHLTVGEYLAATAEIDLVAERARLAVGKRATSEVLPIAHALRAPEALVDALAWAEKGDTGDHVRLGVVLRAITYGGEGVARFAKEHAPRVLRSVVARLHGASGRFGEHEEELAAQAEKAMVLLAPGLGVEDVRLLEDVARGYGRPALEGLLLGWAARLFEPRRHPAFGRAALRAGEALAPVMGSLDTLHELTDGEWSTVRMAAVRALGSDPESRSLLLEALHDHDNDVRAAAVRALGSDPESRSLLLEALRDHATTSERRR